MARNRNGVRVLLDGTKRARSLHRTYIKEMPIAISLDLTRIKLKNPWRDRT